MYIYNFYPGFYFLSWYFCLLQSWDNEITLKGGMD